MGPTDVDPLEDQFVEYAAAYDEALAAGGLPGPPPAAAPQLAVRLARVRDLLVRLESDRRTVAEEMGAAATAPSPQPGWPTEAVGETRRLGRYHVLRELGRGGCGVVFLAWDPSLRREVALKIPRPEALLTAELRRRFLREAQAAAGLDHPGIVPVYEAGEVGPVWYITSAFCEGITLARWLQERTAPVAPRTAAALLLALAEAVHYMHGRGILHRDLKPSNVLLAGEERRAKSQEPEAHSGSPPSSLDSRLLPKITDFGLAKVLEQNGDETRSGLLLGTPAYMSPEQAEGRSQALGPPTDVYSLGVILYEILTGRRPFRGESNLSLLRQITAAEPVPPRRLRGDVPRDLQAICLKCLEKDPLRRYAGAGDLGEDLRRFLAGQPTHARPPAAWERLVKWARRRPMAAALGAVLAVALGAAWGAGLWHYHELNAKNAELESALQEADRQRDRASERELWARQAAYATRIRFAWELWKSGQVHLMGEVLDELRPAAGATDLRGFEWHYLWELARRERALRGHRGALWAVTFSADSRLCASAGTDRTVRVWEVATGKPRWEFPGHRHDVMRLAFSRDGKYLLSAAWKARGLDVKRWDVTAGKLVAEQTKLLGAVRVVALSSDGRTAAAGLQRDGAPEVRLYDLATRRERGLPQPHPVTALAFSPDGALLAQGYCDGAATPPRFGVRLQEVAAGRERAHLPGLTAPVSWLAFAPGGRLLAARSTDGRVKVWDLDTRGERFTLADALAEGSTFSPEVRFSADGRSLATLAHDRNHVSTVSLWDAATGKRRTDAYEPGCQVNCLAFAPDGRTLALGCEDHLVRLRSLEGREERLALPGHRSEAWAVAFSPDGGTLASSGNDGMLRLWDVTAAKERGRLWGHGMLISCVAYAPKGGWLATGGYDRTVKLWEAATGKPVLTLRGHTGPLRCLAFSHNGKRLASAGRDRTVMVWEVPEGRKRFEFRGHTGEIRGVAFSPDGTWGVSASEDQTVQLWDATTGAVRRTLPAMTQVYAVAVTPDGKFLATGNKEGRVTLWDVEKGQAQVNLLGHTDGVHSLAFSPDGRTLASGSSDRTVRLWHVATRQELICLRGPGHKINSVAFSPDGQRLAAAVHDRSVVVWGARGAVPGE